jgi:hypothetical protein
MQGFTPTTAITIILETLNETRPRPCRRRRPRCVGHRGHLYVPLNSSFEVRSVGLAALAARPDASLPLLPSGTLSQRKLDEVQVTSGGNTQTVQLIAQTGVCRAHAA